MNPAGRRSGIAAAGAALATQAVADSHPHELAFIGSVSFPHDVINAVLAWGEDNQVEGNEMAGCFTVTQQELWMSWLPADVATRVKAPFQ